MDPGWIYVPLLYPTGRLLSSRWRRVVVLASIAITTATLCFALLPGQIESSPGLRNPFGIEGADRLGPLGDLSMALVVGEVTS